jgi:hypothetical protein
MLLFGRGFFFMFGCDFFLNSYHYIDIFSFHFAAVIVLLTVSPIGVADSGYFLLDHSATITAYADTPSLLLHDIDSLRVHNSRHFVLGKFVSKLNCS